MMLARTNATLLLASMQQAHLAAVAPSALRVSEPTWASLSWGPSTFTAQGTFPTDAYASYYNNPTQTTAQVQPIVTDPVLPVRLDQTACFARLTPRRAKFTP